MNRIYKQIWRIRAMQRVNLAMARAASTSALRNLDPAKPLTWEFSGFSQNSEDGIVDYLISQLKDSNRTFFEIGSSDGVENNTAWLAVAKRFSGVMVEGDPRLSTLSKFLLGGLNCGVKCVNTFVDRDNVRSLLNLLGTTEPDFFSLDIDGNDYYLMESVFQAGARPKVICVEYNASFGPERAITIPYDQNFRFDKYGPRFLYFGVSINAWRKFFAERNYEFVTVDSNGVNAFFVRNDAFDPAFLANMRGCGFAENFHFKQRYQGDWRVQFKSIENLPFAEI